MGHTASEWRSKVQSLLRETGRADGRDIVAQIDTVGVVPAFAEHSVNRPRSLVVEAAGVNSDTFDLPAGWVPDVSHLTAIEFPARQNPQAFLDDQSWWIIRKTGAIGTEQIQIDRPIPPTSYIRFYFTAPWPTPDEQDETLDLLDDLAFEAVSALAASRCLNTLAIQSARNAFGDENNVATALITASKTYRGVYLRYLGLDIDGTGTSPATAPVSIPLDFDPQYFSVFHGGRR